MNEILKMSCYILIYSFFGWVLESIYKTILEKKLVNSGFLEGPVCPMYGLGAAFLITVLMPLKDNIILLFIAGFFTLTIWEYLVGVLLEKLFKTKYWDYSNVKFNFQGRICLKNSIYWGILGVIFIKLIHPFFEKNIVLIPEKVLLYIVIAAYIILAIDTIITIIKTVKFEKTIKQINELTEKMKVTIKELRTKTTSETVKMNSKALLKKLRIDQTKMKLSLYKLAKRWKLAFPTMKSETISKFLNQKIDFEKLKKLIKNRRKK